MPPFIEGESAPFMVWNRNKRSVVLDLKSVEGKAKLLELVDGADILIENMRPGVMDKLGLGYATLSKRNPRLICAKDLKRVTIGTELQRELRSLVNFVGRARI